MYVKLVETYTRAFHLWFDLSRIRLQDQDSFACIGHEGRAHPFSILH